MYLLGIKFAIMIDLDIRDHLYKRILWGAFVLSFSRFASTSPLNQTNTTTARPTTVNQTNITTVRPTTAALPTLLPPSCRTGKDFWNICWLDTPPYVFTNPKNESQVTGILIEALSQGFEKCKCPTKFKFKRVKSEEELTNCSKSEDVDIVLPFTRKKAANPTWLFTVVDSPNIYLVLNRESVEAQAEERVLSEFFKSVWTIAVLTVLLAIIFGIIVWFLDMTWNQEQFPPTFFPGSLEGIWWSFVTLTTVGYGDKTPKFPVARLFAVVWMFVGMGMVSLLTATMTKALTQAVFDNQDYLQSQKIGVIKHSYTYDEAVKKGAKPVVFSDLKELYTALDEGKMAGILVDTFVATYVRNYPSLFKHENTLFVARSYDVAYPLSFYLARGAIKNPEDNNYINCFEATFDTRNKVINVYEIVEKYIQPPRIDGSASKSTIEQMKFEIHLFKSTERTFIVGVQVLGGTLGVLILLGIVWQVFYRRRFKSRNISRKGDREAMAMATHGRQDAANLKIISEKLEEVDKALGKLSDFRQFCEQYRRELQRYDSGITNGITHAHGATANKGFTAS